MKLKLSGAVLAVAAVGISPAHAANLNAPVTQEQFQQWAHWAQKSVEILERQEKTIEKKQRKDEAQQNQTGQGQNGPVDLGNLGATGTSTAAMPGGGQGNGGLPKMETYFDLNLVNEPGTSEAFNFDNYHSFVFFDLNPSPDFTFSFNLLGPSTYPVFYELDYRASDILTLRAGKIWIPFDDLSQLDPHNIFGGRDGIQQLMPMMGATPLLLLPSVWTELGVGARLMAVNTDFLQLQTDLTITDGFASGGTDPVSTGVEYPAFNYTQPPSSPFAGTDNTGMNHRAKAIDLRAHALFDNVVGTGLTYYTSQWNADNDPNFSSHLNLYILGQDLQFQFGGGYELRLGACEELIYLPEGSTSGNAHRSGTYAELGIPIVPKWRLLVRGGTLDFDNRVPGLTQSLAGATILYNPGVIQFSLESSHAIASGAAVTGFTSYTDLRMIMLF